MYQVQDSAALISGHRRLLRRRRAATVPPAVVALGVTSLLTDISSEMVAAVLPLYLVASLGASPLLFGLIDGLYQGAAALVRIAAGFAGDRRRRHKQVAALGYGLSAVCKIGLLAAGSAFGAIAAIVLRRPHRQGHPHRPARRADLAQLAPGAPRRQLRRAPRDGHHRCDARAAAGVRAARGDPARLRRRLRRQLLLRDPRARRAPAVRAVGSAARGAARERGPGLRETVRLLGGRGMRRTSLAAAILGLATVSDAFLFLGVQRIADLPASAFPLLAVGTALAYMTLAIPAGRAADRWGRPRVLIAGYVLLLGAYGLLLAPLAALAVVAATPLAIGAYYACTDGVLMAMGSGLLPEHGARQRPRRPRDRDERRAAAGVSAVRPRVDAGGLPDGARRLRGSARRRARLRGALLPRGRADGRPQARLGRSRHWSPSACSAAARTSRPPRCAPATRPAIARRRQGRPPAARANPCSCSSTSTRYAASAASATSRGRRSTARVSAT